MIALVERGCEQSVCDRDDGRGTGEKDDEVPARQTKTQRMAKTINAP
jgi:hypothetical protein